MLKWVSLSVGKTQKYVYLHAAALPDSHGPSQDSAAMGKRAFHEDRDADARSALGELVVRTLVKKHYTLGNTLQEAVDTCKHS